MGIIFLLTRISEMKNNIGVVVLIEENRISILRSGIFSTSDTQLYDLGLGAASHLVSEPHLDHHKQEE